MEKHTGIGTINNLSVKCVGCKDCKKRYVGCHSKCETYIAYTKAKDKEYASRRVEYDESESGHYRDGWQFRRKKRNN